MYFIPKAECTINFLVFTCCGCLARTARPLTQQLGERRVGHHQWRLLPLCCGEFTCLLTRFTWRWSVHSCRCDFMWGDTAVKSWRGDPGVRVSDGGSPDAIRPQVLHSGSDVSGGVVRHSNCMWNIHKTVCEETGMSRQVNTFTPAGCKGSLKKFTQKWKSSHYSPPFLDLYSRTAL